MEEQNNTHLEEIEPQQRGTGEKKEAPPSVKSNKPFPPIAIGAIVFVAILFVLIIALGGNKDGNTVCESCGATILANAKFCPDCGIEIELPNDNKNNIDNEDQNNTNKEDQSNSGVTEIYMNEVGTWSNGVEFQIYNHKETSEIDTGLYKYTTDDKFLIIGLRVYNGSSGSFTSSATDVWLLLGDTKILQQNIVERYAQGYDDISQSPTVTKEYFLFFEIGKEVSMSDLRLVINNGKFFSSESVIIKLQDKPKDSTVELNYSYDNKKEDYQFYSGTSLVPSNLPIPSRTGYTFSGWYFNEDYSGGSLTSLTLEHNQRLTLYAKWIPQHYLIYNYQYEDKEEKVYIEYDGLITLPTPSRIGYTFGGWYDNSYFSGNPIAELSNLKENLELYAKWIGNPVYLMYDGNGSTSGEMSNQLFCVGDKLILNKNQFLRDGYIFIGWSIEKTSNDIIDDQSEYTMQPTDNEIVKIYAKWAKEIKTADDFNTINANNTEHYILVNDIDFSNQSAQTIEIFYGVFDGNGHVLKNSSKSPFYINAGEIRNVKLENCKTSCYENSIYAGQLRLSNGKKIQTSLYDNNVYRLRGGMTAYNLGVIKNCSIKVDYSNGVYQEEFGGISGANEGMIINCCSTIDFEISYVANGDRNIGGLVGRNITNGVVENCYSTGSIGNDYSTQGVVYIGGLIGKCTGGTIINCYSNVTINSKFNPHCGGLIGYSYNTTINNCFALGKIDASGYVGGLIAVDSSYLIDNSYRSDVNLFTGSSVCKSGTLVNNGYFYSQEFYTDNNILELYETPETLQENEDAVWIIIDGELPKLYWETTFP